MADLTDSELDSQLAKLLLEKKERDESKQRAELFEAKNKGKPAELLYWQADSYETLNELHKKYNVINFDFCILLHKAIENHDLIFAVKLILSGLIPNMRMFSAEGENYQMQQYLYEYSSKIIALCLEKNDLNRLKLLEIFHIAVKYPRAFDHKFNEIDGISSFENCCMIRLFETNKMITTNFRDQTNNICNQRTDFAKELIKNISATTSKEIIKYVLLTVCHNCNEISNMIDSVMQAVIGKYIDEKDIEMLQFLLAMSNQGSNIARNAGATYLAGRKHIVMTYDFKWFTEITTMLKCQPLSLYYVNAHVINSITFDILKYIIGQELNILNSFDDIHKQNAEKARIRADIRRIIYASEEKRRDIFEYLITLRV